MVRHALDVLTEFCDSSGIFGRASRCADCADGSTIRAAQISKTWCAGAGRALAESAMNILFADLEREWRGGQSQAFLMLHGLRDEGHEVVLVAPNGAPLTERI